MKTAANKERHFLHAASIFFLSCTLFFINMMCINSSGSTEHVLDVYWSERESNRSIIKWNHQENHFVPRIIKIQSIGASEEVFCFLWKIIKLPRDYESWVIKEILDKMLKIFYEGIFKKFFAAIFLVVYSVVLRNFC